MAWITVDDLARVAGITNAQADPGLADDVAVAIDYCQNRRTSSGYVDDPDDVPNWSVWGGTRLKALAVYRLRQAGSWSADDLDPRSTDAQIDRLLGVPKPQVG